MHIPDGYLSPQTSIAAYVVMVPFWAAALARVRRTLRMRQVPMLALGSAFCFVLMMINIPILYKGSGHAVGAVLLAILLGPWEALIAVSMAVAVQALLFGDGGILTFGANCLTMAVVMPFVGYAIYRLVSGASASIRRKTFAAALAGYLGLSMAALVTAILFGIQPLIAHDAAGRALYNPFPLRFAVPIMLGEHLLLFSVVEALVTGLVVAYFARTESQTVMISPHDSSGARRVSPLRRAVVLVGVLMLLTPLGIYLPAHAHAGTAWGEWGARDLHEMIGYLPAGMARHANRWLAPLPGYAVRGQASDSLPVISMWYVASALIGVCVVTGGIVGCARLCLRKDAHDAAP